MKKQFLKSLVVSLVAATMLVGCGANTTPDTTQGSQNQVITQQEQETVGDRKSVV